MRTTSWTVLAFALAACGGTGKQTAIDDPDMEASAKAVGPSTQAIATMSADADQDTISSNVSGLGTNISALASEHQAYAASSQRLGTPALRHPLMPLDLDNITLIDDDTDTLVWDGSHLKGSYSFSDDAETGHYGYDVDMTFTSSGDTYTIDGTYHFDWDLTQSVGSHYKIDATYDGFTLDGTGCATAGTLTVSYDYSFAGLAGAAAAMTGATATKGTVTATFSGCDAVALTGTN